MTRNGQGCTVCPRWGGGAAPWLVDGPAWDGVSPTAREHEVPRLAALGTTNQQIGADLSVSTRTARAHVERFIVRPGVSNRVEAVARAIGLGMLTSPVPD